MYMYNCTVCTDADSVKLRQVFDEVRVEPVTFHNDLVDEERTDWLFLAR